MTALICVLIAFFVWYLFDFEERIGIVVGLVVTFSLIYVCFNIIGPMFSPVLVVIAAIFGPSAAQYVSRLGQEIGVSVSQEIGKSVGEVVTDELKKKKADKKKLTKTDDKPEIKENSALIGPKQKKYGDYIIIAFLFLFAVFVFLGYLNTKKTADSIAFDRTRISNSP